MDNFKFVQNTRCEFFPCHSGVDPAEFNCLFCYCPLYTLAEKCGGRFFYRDNGVKDCSLCSLPHDRNGYEYVRGKIDLVVDMAKKDPGNIPNGD